MQPLVSPSIEELGRGGVFWAMGCRQSLPWTVLIRRPGGMNVLLCHEDGGVVACRSCFPILAGDCTVHGLTLRIPSPDDSHASAVLTPDARDSLSASSLLGCLPVAFFLCCVGQNALGYKRVGNL
ncbi:uncharacterized protein LOC123410600 [Hordeum vulgare subsp. vulgare]|uniref:uncharacterized protein LOC123410600 n=1 Tax=Hordeum vulgare subsp. vulgare TaxID=112509 RepID=UPI001D1A46A5|nr:uncharacterized protein LOC123410600 [Hordeum vulgare subsp. vulgare]